MKRHFLTGLKALAVSALAFAAVSCYDDSELWGELEGLEQRVAALEQKLNTEVATLNSKLGAVEAAYKKADEAFNIADENVSAALKALTAELDALDGTVDGYVTSNDAALKKAIEDLMKADKENADAYKALADMDADLLAALSKLGVVSVEKKEDGSVVLTFADKSTVTVGAPVENADNTGLVTIVDGEWAVIDEDGVVKKLGVPVDPETELFFRVKDNVLEISYDGKKTWVSTEVEVNDETSLNIVTGVEYTEGDEYVTIVVGDAEYVLPFYQADNSDLTLGRTEAFFMYGATKDIKLTAEGVAEYYVMSKPDGWKASIEGTTLTVTAPSKELVELGAGELEGEVLVHATADNGTCKVAKIEVTTGAPLTVSYNNGNISVFSAYTDVESGEMGEEMKSFAGLWFNLTPLEDYLYFDSFKEFMEFKPDPESNITTVYRNVNQSGYIEGECEELVLTMPLTELLEKSWFMGSFEEGVPYVFWVVPQGPSSYLYDEAVYTIIGNHESFVEDEAYYNNVEISAALFGAKEYIIGAKAKSDFDAWVDEEYTYEMALKDWLIGSYMPGPFTKLVEGDKAALGKSYNPGKQIINLSDLVFPNEYSGEVVIDANAEYYVWMLPLYDGKPLAEYDVTDLKIYTQKTDSRTKGEAAKAVAEILSVTYNSFEYKITPSEGGKYYFDVFPKEVFEELYVVEGQINDDAIYNDYKSGYAFPEIVSEVQTYDCDFNPLVPGADYVFVTYGVCDEHYYVNTVDFKTLTLNEYIATLEAGATWTLTGDLELTEPIEINKNLTIDLNDCTLTTAEATDDWSAAIIVYSGNVTIKNGTIATSGKSAHKSVGALWVRGSEAANVTIEKAILKGNNWDETVEGQTDCQATVYVSNSNGYVTINSGEFYCVKQEQVAGQNQILNYKNEFTTQNIVVKGGTFYGMDPAKGNGVEVSYVAEGYESTETAEDVYTVAMRTPAGKQWVFESTTLDAAVLMGMGSTEYCFLLTDGQSVVAYDAEPLGAPAGTWAQASNIETFTVVPTDASSGTIEINGKEVTYSDFDGDSCTFDLSALLNGMPVVVDATLATEEITLYVG